MKQYIKCTSREELDAIIRHSDHDHASVRNKLCSMCGKPCGKKIFFSWYHGKRLMHYPDCKLAKGGRGR